jgi:acyl-homoserine lactone synthase
MIDCVTHSNAHRFEYAIDQMFRCRYELFVNARGWRDLQHSSGRERDQFDTQDAVYLLSIDPDGTVTGGLRLLPTAKPHLLSDCFPHLAIDGVPRGPQIYEMTRYFTVRDRSQPQKMQRVAGELLCSMFEYCLRAEACWITTVFDTFFLRRMRQNCWGETLLGAPTPYAEGTAVAIKIPVSRATLQSTRAAHGIEGPVLRPADLGRIRERRDRELTRLEMT